jgi:hypothetical protein
MGRQANYEQCARLNSGPTLPPMARGINGSKPRLRWIEIMLAVAVIAGPAFLVLGLIASQSTLRVDSCGSALL